MGIGDLKPAPQVLLKCSLKGKRGIDIFKDIFRRMMIDWLVGRLISAPG